MNSVTVKAVWLVCKTSGTLYSGHSPMKALVKRIFSLPC